MRFLLPRWGNLPFALPCAVGSAARAPARMCSPCSHQNAVGAEDAGRCSWGWFSLMRNRFPVPVTSKGHNGLDCVFILIDGLFSLLWLKKCGVSLNSQLCPAESVFLQFWFGLVYNIFNPYWVCVDLFLCLYQHSHHEDRLIKAGK